MVDFQIGDRVKITRPMLHSQRQKSGMVGLVSGVINNAEVGGDYLEIKFDEQAPFRVLASRCDLEGGAMAVMFNRCEICGVERESAPHSVWIRLLDKDERRAVVIACAPCRERIGDAPMTLAGFAEGVRACVLREAAPMNGGGTP